MLREAAEAYEEILRRKPRHPAALKLAADLARERGDLKLAGSYYARLRAVAPADPRPVFLMAAAHADAGNLELAERLFTEGAYFPGMRGDALSNLAALALRRGEPRQALWFASRAAKLRPEKASVRYNHALALHEAGRHAEALGEVRAAELLDPADGGLRFFAGVVALRLGLLDEAAHSFSAALALDPLLGDARHNLRLLESMGIGGERSLSLEEGEGSGAPVPAPPPPPAPRLPAPTSHGPRR
jgi:Flp pilus assembly protein TadD